MAQQLATTVITLKAGAAISAGMVVKMSADNTVVKCTTTVTDVPIGIALNDIASGAYGSIVVGGLAKALPSGTQISAGTWVANDSGTAGSVKAAATTQYPIGLCVEGQSGANTEYITILVVPSSIPRA